MGVIVRVLRRVPARQIVNKVRHVMRPGIAEVVHKAVVQLPLQAQLQRVVISIAIVRGQLNKGVLPSAICSVVGINRVAGVKAG